MPEPASRLRDANPHEVIVAKALLGTERAQRCADIEGEMRAVYGAPPKALNTAVRATLASRGPEREVHAEHGHSVPQRHGQPRRQEMHLAVRHVARRHEKGDPQIEEDRQPALRSAPCNGI